MTQAHVPTSIAPQPYPYALDFRPPTEYSKASIDVLSRNMLDLYSQVERDLQRRWALVVNNPAGGAARARLNDLFASLERSRQDVESSALQWMQTAFPGFYAQGMTNMRAGYSSDPASWTQPHRDAVGLLAVDTFDSLLRPSQFEPDEIKATVRELARASTAEAIIGGKTATQAGADLADKLAARGIFGVTYADGKFVRGSSYADMVVRTRSAIAYNAGGINQARADGVEVFEISDGPECGLASHDDDQLADGMIIDPDTAASYPISHPNCVRSFLPRPDLTPTDVAAGNFDTIRDPEQSNDQAAFDLFLRQAADTRGLTLTQAAREYGRQERTGRVPRLERAPRTPRNPTAPASAAAAVHPFLAPLARTEPSPIAVDPNVRTTSQLMARDDARDWIRVTGAPGPKMLEREAAYNEVGGSVLSLVEQRLAAEGVAKPPSDAEIRAVQRESAKLSTSIAKRAEKIRDRFEAEHPEFSFRGPGGMLDHRKAEGDAFDTEKWNKDRKAALVEFDKRYATLTFKYEAARERGYDLQFQQSQLEPQFYARAREVTLDVLREIRPMGAEVTNATHNFPSADVMAAIGKATELYPAEWVERSNLLGQIAFGDGDRGYYRDVSNGDSEIVLSKGSRSKLPGDIPMSSVAVHELGHRMEMVVDEIRSVEHAFYERRTAGETDERLSKLIPGSSYGPNERGRADEFVDPYMGKSYGALPTSSYELVSMALEGLWTGSNQVWHDPDMLRFILGLLAGA